MPLQSAMFKDDRALQAALVSDPAHIVQGARGPHVAKIQKALLVLDGAHLPHTELLNQVYGPATAAAVLAYKKEREIINKTYQRTADNIVGKMTIKRMDDELMAIDAKPHKRVVCQGGGGGTEAIRMRSGILPVSNLEAVTGPRARRFNATLHIMWQETDAAVKIGGGIRLLFDLVQRARQLLAPHGMDFGTLADAGLIAITGPQVPDADANILTGSNASLVGVRKLADHIKGFVPPKDTLRVICCPFHKDDPAFGVTDAGHEGGEEFPKFCLINVRKHHADSGTLLHEMVHAARPEFVNHDSDGRSVFSEATAGRNLLPLRHAESLANAFFAVRRF